VRALRRSRGNLAFWRWLIGYRRGSLPTVMAAIAAIAGDANFTCSARRAPSNDSSAGREHDQQSTDLDKQPIISAKSVSIAKAARPQPSTFFNTIHQPKKLTCADVAGQRERGRERSSQSFEDSCQLAGLGPSYRNRSPSSEDPVAPSATGSSVKPGPSCQLRRKRVDERRTCPVAG